MGLLPPRFSNDTTQLSDSEAARRFTVKPQTVVDAAYLGQRDIVLGIMAGLFGYVHDISAGACLVPAQKDSTPWHYVAHRAVGQATEEGCACKTLGMSASQLGHG